ncbi:hypothetical protein [Synechococcus phage MA10]
MNHKHGHYVGRKGTPTYNSWRSMRIRVETREGYIERGMCQEWEDFDNFLRDMGERPEGTTLDRIDNSKGYFPENCRWATKRQQDNNRSNCVIIEHNGRSLTLMEWSRETGLSHACLRHRLNKQGLRPPELFQPLQRKRK